MTPADKLSETLRGALEREPGALPVIFEVALDRAAPDPYAALPAAYAALSDAVRAAGGELVAPPAIPIAPYVFARVTADQMSAVLASSAALIAHAAFNEWLARDEQPRSAFDPRTLIGEVIAEPLATRVRTDPAAIQPVIVHLDMRRTSKAARAAAVALLERVRARDPAQTAYRDTGDASHPYVFATMSGYAILALIDLDRAPEAPARTIYRVWEDATVRAFITQSVATVKADAANKAFAADGRDVVWAVLDTGIDATHPHFAHYGNLDLSARAPLAHRDLRPNAADDAAATVDANGHGTHVAGIIAGAMDAQWGANPVAVVSTRNEAGAIEKQTRALGAVAGMAPRCTIVSLRVLDDDSTGAVSALISAIEQIQQWNEFGRHLRVHGVNLSLGYPFEAEWFACGQTPLCIEINRLVESGVVVVAAAGNSGYAYEQTEYTGAISHCTPMSINDPGNADLAITVGSTHRTEPHLYGVSYFSSKGPTGDGRAKPDLLAPGERIISCASAQSRTEQAVIAHDGAPPAALAADAYTYKEDSGTSMAAPHVSGIIAGFLSIRSEYIGRPREVKAIFMQSATDLGRDRSFQGAGLADLMRAIQSV